MTTEERARKATMLVVPIGAADADRITSIIAAAILEEREACAVDARREEIEDCLAAFVQVLNDPSVRIPRGWRDTFTTKLREIHARRASGAGHGC